ncbi:hypothetical protein [Achromobacter animicus]|uniref:hypothetical protein n=1 Tax=Achromobacter animicus TaxID=1389935 RepID=UPI00345EC935
MNPRSGAKIARPGESLSDIERRQRNKFLGKIGAWAEQEPIKERLAKASDRWQAKLVQGIFDQFAPLKGISATAYMQAHLSKGADGAAEYLVRHGAVKLQDGALDTYGGKGLAEILAGLNGEHDHFMAWIAANRVERQAAEWHVRFDNGVKTSDKDRNSISLEWVIAAIPLYVWLVAYFYGQGEYIAAGVPRVVSEMGFTSVLNASVFAAILVIFPVLGASGHIQRFYSLSPRTALGSLVTVVGCYAVVLAFTASPSRALAFAHFFIITIVLVSAGVLARKSVEFNGLFARLWRWSWLTRIVVVFLYVELVCGLALWFGYSGRLMREGFTVIESKCGPPVEVFQRTGESVVLLHHTAEPRIEIRSLSSGGTLLISKLTAGELESRTAMFGPCPKW